MVAAVKFFAVLVLVGTIQSIAADQKCFPVSITLESGYCAGTQVSLNVCSLSQSEAQSLAANAAVPVSKPQCHKLGNLPGPYSNIGSYQN